MVVVRLAPCPPILKRSILITSGGEPAARAVVNFSRSREPWPAICVSSRASTVMWGSFCWKAAITASSGSWLEPVHLPQ